MGQLNEVVPFWKSTLCLCLFCLSCFSQSNTPTLFTKGGLQVPLDNSKEADITVTRLEDLATVRVLPESLQYLPLSESELEAFAYYLDGLASDLQLPGYALAIVQGGDIVLKHTVGLRKITESPQIDEDTVFNIGPATGAFTSLMAATLDGEKGYSYDKLARRVWPSFRMNDMRSADQITIYNFFTMTAGIPSYTDKILDPSWARPEDVFDVIAQAPIIAPPGLIYENSVVSTAAAGYLTAIADVSNEDFYTAYTTAMHKRLIEPLGMSTATFSREAAMETGNYASPHSRKGPGYDPVKPWEPQVNAMAPALGLKASLNDMVRWLSSELRGGLAPDGTRVADSVSVQQRWQPARVRNSKSYGMGWTRQYYTGVEIIATMGSYDRQSAGIGILPGFRTGFVIMINADGEDANRLMQEVALGIAEIVAVRQKEAAAAEQN